MHYIYRNIRIITKDNNKHDLYVERKMYVIKYALHVVEHWKEEEEKKKEPSTEKGELNKEHMYRGMNKGRERMNEDKKIETVKDRRARGSSLVAAGMRVQF